MGFASLSQKRVKTLVSMDLDLVMEEILTRLPAKSLMRFKSVSKLWSCHITSLHFTKRFLTVRSKPQPRLYMCLTNPYDYGESLMLFAAPRDSSTLSSFVVDHALTIQHMGSNILQCLCGFMCYTVGRSLHIFNPATRLLVTLSSRSEDDYKHVSYYLGYDQDEYKVVCSTGVYVSGVMKFKSELWVFTLKTGGGLWKKMAPDFCPHIAWPKNRGMCLDGVIYYMALVGFGKFGVVCFDIRTEEFKMIQVPFKDGEDKYQACVNRSLVDYGGKLTLLNCVNLKGNGVLDLLVLEDVSNEEWSRKTVVLQPSQLHLVNEAKFFVRGTTQNGKVILMQEKFLYPFHFLCYDLQSKDMRKIEIEGIPEQWFSKDKANLDLMFMDQCESVMHLET